MKAMDPAIRAKLRFVRVSPEEQIDLANFPSFLIAGPQRTGTTWLHGNLVPHPQIFMPAQKEIYYFNSLRRPEDLPEKLRPSPDLAKYLSLFEPTPEYLAKRNAECQAQFGEDYQITARGEATASYAAGLDREVIAEMLTLRPDMRVIIMIRNPVERAWSHAKKDLWREGGTPMQSIDPQQFRKFFGDNYQIRCGSYTEILKTWQSMLQPEHLFCGRFDDISEDPVGLLCRIFKFLGVRSDERYVGAKARTRINETNDVDLPPELRELLEGMYKEELERLAAIGMRWD